MSDLRIQIEQQEEYGPLFIAVYDAKDTEGTLGTVPFIEAVELYLSDFSGDVPAIQAMVDWLRSAIPFAEAALEKSRLELVGGNDLEKRFESLEQRLSALEANTIGLRTFGGSPAVDFGTLEIMNEKIKAATYSEPIDLGKLRPGGVVVKVIDGQPVRYVDPEK